VKKRRKRKKMEDGWRKKAGRLFYKLMKMTYP
jgi:hypothetical protein